MDITEKNELIENMEAAENAKKKRGTRIVLHPKS